MPDAPRVPEPMSAPRIEIARSARSTLGVEWELLLVDQDSGAARQCAPAVLEALREQDGQAPSGIVGELLRNTVELVTGVCTTVAQAGQDLQASLARVRAVADPMRAELTSAGAHPFARWQEQQVTDSARYATLIDRTQWWGRQMTIYGVHVHVGIADPEAMIPIVNALLTEAGTLLALTASSPYWQGEATQYASHRSLLFQQLPTAGLPYQFEDWSRYESYVQDMLDMGVIDRLSEIRWDIRPVPSLGTIEVRVADGLPTLREVLAHAALVQCLVEDFATRRDHGEQLPTLAPWQVAENKWRAARYGMDAILVVSRDGREQLVTDHARELLDHLAPVAERLGCADELASVADVLAAGAPYQRLRAAAEHPGASGRDLVAHLVAETRENAMRGGRHDASLPWKP